MWTPNTLPFENKNLIMKTTAAPPTIHLKIKLIKWFTNVKYLNMTYSPSWVMQGWLSWAVSRWNNPDCNRVAPAASPGVIPPKVNIWRLSLESSGNAEIKSV